MRLAGAGSGAENRVGRGLGSCGVCDRAGPRSVTRLQRKVAVTRESPPGRATAAELSQSPCVKAGARSQSSASGASRSTHLIRITRRRLFHDRRVRFGSQTTRRASTCASRVLFPYPPGFRTRPSARPATGTTCVGTTPKPRTQGHPRRVPNIITMRRTVLSILAGVALAVTAVLIIRGSTDEPASTKQVLADAERQTNAAYSCMPPDVRRKFDRAAKNTTSGSARSSTRCPKTPNRRWPTGRCARIASSTRCDARRGASSCLTSRGGASTTRPVTTGPSGATTGASPNASNALRAQPGHGDADGGRDQPAHADPDDHPGRHGRHHVGERCPHVGTGLTRWARRASPARDRQGHRPCSRPSAGPRGHRGAILVAGSHAIRPYDLIGRPDAALNGAQSLSAARTAVSIHDRNARGGGEPASRWRRTAP